MTKSKSSSLPKLKKKTKLKRYSLELLYEADSSGLFFDNRRDKNLIDVETAGKICGVTSKTIHNWVYLGFIPYIKLGRKVMFYPSSVVKWLKQKEFKP